MFKRMKCESILSTQSKANCNYPVIYGGDTDIRTGKGFVPTITRHHSGLPARPHSSAQRVGAHRNDSRGSLWTV